MSLDDLIAERLRFFELVDLDESQLELLCQRRETLDACKYYNSGPLQIQNSAFAGDGKLTIFHHNVRSLLKNGEHFKDLVLNLNIKISCLLVTETWLREATVPPSLNGFTFNQQNRIGRNGGGVAIYFDSSLNHVIREDLKFNSSSFESIFVEIDCAGSKNIIIGCIYRPPDGDFVKFLEELESLLDKLKGENKIVYLGGDFNINLLHYSGDGQVSKFLELLLSQNLYPTLSRPTRVSEKTNTLIDCIFTNFLGPAVSGVIVDTTVSDHFPIVLTSDHSLKSNRLPRVLNRRITADKTKAFRRRLTALFRNFHSIDTANEALNFFCDTIESEIDNFYHLHQVCRKCTPLRPWIDSRLLERINTKNSLYKEYLKDKSSVRFAKFRTFRNQLKSDIRTSKKQYYCKLIEENKDNAKRSWQILNEVTGRTQTKSCTINQLSSKGKTVEGRVDIANTLNDFFSSIGTEINNSVPFSTVDPNVYIQSDEPDTCYFYPVDAENIRTILGNLNDSGGANCPTSSKVLKLLAPAIIGPLSHIVNLAFETGCFPDRLKISSVTPIFKQGKKDDPGNYRPISVLSPISKIIEKCMKERILNFIEHKNLFAENQYGFRNKHSTEHALINFMDYVTEELEKGNSIIGVYLDIKKAFDSVNFQILFKKLSRYGIRGQPLALIQSYLTNRKQKVKLIDGNGTAIYSELRNVTCGVPQGSVLGPLLFLIYINDLQNASGQFHVITFADDTNLFMSAPSTESLCNSVNMELQKVKTWLDCNRLCLNVSKTCYQLYTKRTIEFLPDIKINDASIMRANSVKFLGVVVDEQLSFKYHIENVARKLTVGIGFLYRGREVLGLKELMLLYNTLLLPHLNYCSLVWGINYPTNLHKLQILQKRAIRVILGLGYSDPVTHVFRKLGISPISELVEKKCLMMIYKIKHHMAPMQMHDLLDWRSAHSDAPRVRHRGPLIVPFARTKYKQHTFKIFAPKLLNSLSASFDINFDVPISAFKARVRELTRD